MEKTKQIIIDFVEGRMDIDKFHELIKNDNELRNLICGEKPYSDEYNDFIEMVDKINWESTIKQFEIALAFEFFAKKFDKNLKATDVYLKRAQALCTVIPSWLSDEASDYVEEEIIEKVPKGLTKTETKAWIKAKIKETFKYEKRPPQWAQEGNWPRDEEGNFLTFRSQKEDGDLVTYTFVNPKTGEEVQTQEFF